MSAILLYSIVTLIRNKNIRKNISKN
jgi:hypothetical protein